MAQKLYCSITNSSGVENVTITESHDSSTTMATFEVRTTSLTLGDVVEIDLGYVGNHAKRFSGYVKQIDKRAPNNIYSVTAVDVMTRALDFFVAASNPEEPLKYRNIKAEDLVQNLMSLAGLTNFTATPTSFVFGVQEEFEINLVPVYDYCRAIGDNLTWHLYADINGQIHFENRKPYVMVDEYPENVQPGWSADTSMGYTITDVLSIEQQRVISEKNLRNRVVVYGSTGVSAEASRSVSLLPAGFYKTSVLGDSGLIDSEGLAQTIADYNLDLFCRYTEECRVSVIGDPSLRARTCVGSTLDILGTSGLWYVSSADHQLNSSGYITTLSLRRMIKV